MLIELVEQDAAANRLCRRVRPLLEQAGIATFKKHQATHVLRENAGLVKSIAQSVVGEELG